MEDVRYINESNTRVSAIIDGQQVTFPATDACEHFRVMTERGIAPAPFVPAVYDPPAAAEQAAAGPDLEMEKLKADLETLKKLVAVMGNVTGNELVKVTP